MTATPIVRLNRVSKSFSGPGNGYVPVLEAVDLTILPGEKVSLTGPSGSGKSTLLALIAGLLVPDSGTVEVAGVPLARRSERERADVRARTIGFALQSDNLIPFLTARENVELALGFGSLVARRQAPAAARDLLGRFGVSDRADHYPRHLSGGEAQRVALAVAIANRPTILLADEVVAQLDAKTAGRVVEEILSIEVAVLYITHDVSLADLATARYQLTDHVVHAR